MQQLNPQRLESTKQKRAKDTPVFEKQQPTKMFSETRFNVRRYWLMRPTSLELLTSAFIIAIEKCKFEVHIDKDHGLRSRHKQDDGSEIIFMNRKKIVELNEVKK